MDLNTLRIIIAGIGLMLATSSFISGLQLVRGRKASVEGKIHRFNGYASITLYLALSVLYFMVNPLRALPLLGWAAGFFFVVLKISIVWRRGRAFKYVPWMGVTIILVWLYIVYIHIPI